MAISAVCAPLLLAACSTSEPSHDTGAASTLATEPSIGSPEPLSPAEQQLAQRLISPGDLPGWRSLQAPHGVMTDPQCQVGIVRSVGSSIGSGTGVVIVQVTDEYSSSEAAKAAEAHASDIDYCAAPGEPPTPKSGQWRPYRGAPVPEGVTVLTHQSEVLGQPTLLFRSQHGRTQTRALLGWDSESTPDSIEEMVQQVASALEARA